MKRLNHPPNQPRAPMHTATKLRQRINDPTAPILLCPGIYDGLSTRIALSVGFETLYLTDAGTSAPLTGDLDNDHADRPEIRTHAQWIATLAPSLVTLSKGIPLIADADTEYGGPVMIRRTVQLYAHSGIAGLHIEDRLEDKDDKEKMKLTTLDEFVDRVRAGVEGREAMASDIMIIVCTRALYTIGIDEAIKRLKAARAVGADMGFVTGVRSKEEAAKVVKEAGFPCLLNMTYGGPTPEISVQEAEKMGYRAIIFPTASIAPASKVIANSLRALKKSGRMSEEDRATTEAIVSNWSVPATSLI